MTEGRLSDKAKKGFVRRINAQRLKTAKGLEMRGKSASAFYTGPGQPTAANMEYVRWSDEIAEVADDFAWTCPAYRRSNGNNLGELKDSEGYPWEEYYDYDYSGEETPDPYCNSKTDCDVSRAVKSWMSDSILARHTFKDTYIHAKDRHQFEYTQLVWATTYLVGCGDKECMESEYDHERKVVCNFGHAGNKDGQSVYIAGPPCSQCPVGKSFCLQGGLCASKSDCDENPDMTCECKLKKKDCKRGEKFNKKSCTCKCKGGGKCSKKPAPFVLKKT